MSRVLKIIASLKRPRYIELYWNLPTMRNMTGVRSNNESTVPTFVERLNEPTEVKRSRLVYQSRKRGMLENGLLLSTFAAKHLNTLNDDDLKAYDCLINEPSNDWDIYYWATGARDVPPEYMTHVMDLLKEHARNDERVMRIQQPDNLSKTINGEADKSDIGSKIEQ